MDLNVLHLHEGSDEINAEQISLVLGGNWLLSFNEGPQPWARVLRDRLRADKAHCRKGGPDYLAYSIIDAVVDDYYKVLERIGDRMEKSRRSSWPPRRRRRCTRSTPSSAR